MGNYCLLFIMPACFEFHNGLLDFITLLAIFSHPPLSCLLLVKEGIILKCDSHSHLIIWSK